MSNYINTPVYSNQLSKKHMNKNNNGFYFLKLNAPETLNSKTIKEKYGDVKAISINVPDFAVKGSVIAKESDKVYKLDKDKEGKVVDFNPLILDENKKKSWW